MASYIGEAAAEYVCHKCGVCFEMPIGDRTCAPCWRCGELAPWHRDKPPAELLFEINVKLTPFSLVWLSEGDSRPIIHNGELVPITDEESTPLCGVCGMEMVLSDDGEWRCPIDA